MARTCGDCTVCCVYPRIKDGDLDKPAMIHCPFLSVPNKPVENQVFYTGKYSENNCTVYNTDKKPSCCTDYKCLWLEGYGDEEDRPDKSLMLFDRIRNIENSIHAKPLKPDHEKASESRELIDKMSREAKTPVIVLDFYKRRIVELVGRPLPDSKD